MRTILMLIVFVALMAFLTSWPQAYPNCTQVADRCQPHGDCVRSIQWGSYCENNLRLWRCCWYRPLNGTCKDSCTTYWSYCHCDTPEGCDCLLAGTPIRLEDGGTKPVEKIEVGDRVLSYDESMAMMTTSEVTSVHKPFYVDHYYIINEELRATENHPVLSGGKWVTVSSLAVGDMLNNPDGWDIEIFTVRKIEERAKVYNFQVAMETYVAADMIVHNKEDCEEYDQYYPE